MDDAAIVRPDGATRSLAVTMDVITPIVDDARAIEEAGAIGLEIEAVPYVVGKAVDEIDVSIADVMAHTSFKTPTACAAGLAERVRADEQRALTAWAEVGVLAPNRLREADRTLRDVALHGSERFVAPLSQLGAVGASGAGQGFDKRVGCSSRCSATPTTSAFTRRKPAPRGRRSATSRKRSRTSR